MIPITPVETTDVRSISPVDNQSPVIQILPVKKAVTCNSIFARDK